MKITVLVSRILLGLIFFVFGLNGFLNFIPLPDVPETADLFLKGLGNAVYFFPLLKVAEILGGLALLMNRFVPLTLIILAPINLQIFLFHIFLAPGGLAMAMLMIVIHFLLAYHHRESYEELFKP